MNHSYVDVVGSCKIPWKVHTHDGSVCMLYMVCHLPSIYPSYVSINLPYIHTDPSWVIPFLYPEGFTKFVVLQENPSIRLLPHPCNGTPQMLHGAGIFTYMTGAIFGVNVGKYSIHGASGLCKWQPLFWENWLRFLRAGGYEPTFPTVNMHQGEVAPMICRGSTFQLLWEDCS